MKLTAVRPQRLMSSNIVPCKSSCTILRYTKWYSNCIMLTLHQTCTICFFYRHDDEYASTRGTMKETKFLVFFSALMELLASCSRCLAPCTLSTTVIGTFLSVKQLCTSCGHLRTWNSQPCIGKGALPAGNLLLSASILYAGASPTQVLRVLEFLSVPTITQRTFFRHQTHYLMPSASRVWEKEKAALIAAAQNRGLPLNLGGDGSPGHSAKFGSYSIIDLDQNKVIDVQLVQVCM